MLYSGYTSLGIADCVQAVHYSLTQVALRQKSAVVEKYSGAAFLHVARLPVRMRVFISSILMDTASYVVNHAGSGALAGADALVTRGGIYAGLRP